MLRHFLSSFVLFSLLLFTLIHPSSIHADEKVSSSVHMQYDVSASGNTHVSATVSLTNTTENFYVSSYSLALGFSSISHVTASDPSGPITPSIKPTQHGQQITLNFNDVVAGKGKALPFTLSFDTPDIATLNGSIWEINIPGLASSNDFQDFSADISVPSTFGPPTFIKPEVSGTSLHFTKDQLGKSGISLAFGTSQTYSYTLTYHLQSTNVFPVSTEIALPPTTNYQNVSLQSLSPAPANVTLDTDGNWLAHYQLLPSQKLTVTASGLIAVSLSPKEQVLSQQDRKIYLARQPYWQIDNQQVAQLAKSLQNPEAIYDYVVSHLTYDFNRVKNNQIRIGAAGVLQDPTSAVCLEFTDLFVALARAAGIPAREVDGFAYTQNTISRPLSLSEDVLHAWPEYYDDNTRTWVMVDPTWGNTTGGVDYFHQLDFDHVAFVVKGVSDDYPVPAGGYKFAGNISEKDVAVTVTSEKITDEPTVSMQLTFPESIVAGLPLTATVGLKNTGSVLFPSQPMTVLAGILSPRQQFITTRPIPPFGSTAQQVYFSKTPFLTNSTDTVTIVLAGKSIQRSVKVVPITRQALIIGGIALVLLTLIIWIIAKRPWRV